MADRIYGIYNNSVLPLLLKLFAVVLSLLPIDVRAQIVDDGSDAAIGPTNTRTVLDLIGRNLTNASDAKVTALRRTEGTWICGSVNVKNKDGLYSGERGFVVDLSDVFFGRVPDGPEMLSSRAEGFEEKERIRRLYFKMCLD